MVNKDHVTPFQRLLQIRANVPYIHARRTWGLSKALFKSALKADAKRMAASPVNPSQLTQVGFAVT